MRDVDAGFATILGERLEALSIHAYVPVLANRNRIVELAAQNRVVTIYPMRDFVEAGGLFSYGANLVENAKRAAVNLDKTRCNGSVLGMECHTLRGSG